MSEAQPPTINLSHTSEIRVRYAETDAMQVAHHANYPIWFEVGRGDMMHELGLPYTEVEEQGFYLMLVNLEVKYRSAARYDDLLTLETRVGEIKTRSMSFEYTLYKGETVVATGTTWHVATDKNYRPRTLPENVVAKLRGEG